MRDFRDRSHSSFIATNSATQFVWRSSAKKLMPNAASCLPDIESDLKTAFSRVPIPWTDAFRGPNNSAQRIPKMGVRGIDLLHTGVAQARREGIPFFSCSSNRSGESCGV
jgi:hypothetical protein